jgi:phage/plasmid-associated DNA primase
MNPPRSLGKSVKSAKEENMIDYDDEDDNNYNQFKGCVFVKKEPQITFEVVETINIKTPSLMIGSKGVKPINLTFHIQPSTIDDVVFLEMIDVDKLKTLIICDELPKNYDKNNYSQVFASKLYANEKQQLEKYLEKYNKKSKCIPVKHKKPNHKIGRIFPFKALGLSCLPRKTRDTLIIGDYVDIDLANAQPTILYNICVANNINCDFITQYINNREVILKEVCDNYSVSRQQAKKLFIRLSFMGTTYGWCKMCNIPTETNQTPFIKGFINELKNIAEIIKEQNPDLYETCKKLKFEKGETNVIGSFFSFYLQEYETRIMECCINYITNKTDIANHFNSNLKILTYEYDGLKLLKQKVESYGGVRKIMNELENVIYDEMGFRMSFEEKPIHDIYNLTLSIPKATPVLEVETPIIIRRIGCMIDPSVIKDPYKCAELISPKLKDTLLYCKENWYILNRQNLWNLIKDPIHEIVHEIRKYIDDSLVEVALQIRACDDENERKDLLVLQKQLINLYNETQLTSYLSVIKSHLKITILDNELIDKLDMTREVLVFQNGVMDLRTKTFREGVLSSDYVSNTIPFDYTNNFNVEKRKYVEKQFTRILNNNTEHYQYLFSLLGACLLGRPDWLKMLLFWIDKTELSKGDNGKSFIVKILSHIFPNYVYKTKETLIDKHYTKTHKQLTLMKGKRIVYIEELPNDKDLNYSLLKDISDGEAVENEVMYGTSEKIQISFSLVILSNHIPKIDPSQEAVYNRYKQVSFTSHFDRTGERQVENEETLEFIADTTLGERLTKDYRDEIYSIMIDFANLYYTRMKKLPSIPEQFISDTKETRNKNDKFISWFYDNIIKNDDSKVALKRICVLSGVKEDDVKLTMKRLGYSYNKELKGIGKDQFGKYYKGGYVGIEIKEEDDVDEEDD